MSPSEATAAGGDHWQSGRAERGAIAAGNLDAVAASERFGSLPLGQCLVPAIRLAEQGFAMARKPVVRLTRTLDVVKKSDAARRLFLGPDAAIPATGERRSNPE
jgi:gamma-glutamyltranspeptidase